MPTQPGGRDTVELIDPTFNALEQVLGLADTEQVSRPLVRHMRRRPIDHRVHRRLRRSERAAAVEQYSFDDVLVDFSKMELTRAGQAVPMTPQEFKILKYFAANKERVISRDDLLNEVWGYNCYPSTRTVDNHILKLRQKLEKDPANPVHFLTVHGAGYKFVP